MAYGLRSIYKDIRRALAEVTRETVEYLDRTLEITVPNGTLADTRYYLELTPSKGHYLAIRFFDVYTPLEVKGRILLTHASGKEEWTDEVAANSNVLFDAGDYDKDFFLLKKAKIYAIADTDTTADRLLKCIAKGGEVTK